MTYIDPRGKAFAHLDRLAAWTQGAKPAPVTIEWDLSNRCSLGCQSCHFAYTHTKGPWVRKDRRLPLAHDPAGDLADTRLVLRALGEAAAVGVKAVIWTGGGDPTTHRDWRMVVSHAQRLGLAQGMYTFGGLLSRSDCAHLAEALTWVVISLDCVDAETYAREKGVPPDRFEPACQAVRWLAETRQTVVGASFLLHAANWRQAPQMLELARRLGATYTTFRPTITTQPDAPHQPIGDRTWVAKALPWLASLAKTADVECDPPRFAEWANWQTHGYATCYGIRLNTTITPDGRVWVCPNRRGYAGSAIGDLRQESFGDVWARHPGAWTVDRDCRAMCRLHTVNTTLAAVYQPRPHEAFI